MFCENTKGPSLVRFDLEHFEFVALYAEKNRSETKTIDGLHWK
jgi:hypothetical protein